MRPEPALKLFLLLIAVFSTTGCGRTYHIKGRVIVLPEIKSESGFITEFSSDQLPLGGIPIAGASLTMFHDLDDSDQPMRDSVWHHDTETNSEGYFDTSDCAAPGSEAKVGLEIRKSGYKTVYTTYIDYSNKEPQVFLVVLVPISSMK